jgi:cytochrome c6
MQRLIRYFISSGMVCLVALVTTTQAQSGPATIYKTNCGPCHGSDGSADTPTGKALHAKDLRSQEVQTKSDAELADVITKGNGGMPAFGARLASEDVQKLVAYIRDLAKKE